jgi:hypothetical protein
MPRRTRLHYAGKSEPMHCSGYVSAVNRGVLAAELKFFENLWRGGAGPLG